MEEWSSFFKEYKLPSLTLPGHFPALSFGLAGPGTGVPFHFHGPGFAETIYGRKRWFLTPPDVKPEFHPNKTTLQWFYEDYPRIRENIFMYECTLKPGEVRSNLKSDLLYNVEMLLSSRNHPSNQCYYLYFFIYS